MKTPIHSISISRSVSSQCGLLLAAFCEDRTVQAR